MKIYYTVVLFTYIAFSFSCTNNNRSSKGSNEASDSLELLKKWSIFETDAQRKSDLLNSISLTVKGYSNGNSNISDNVINDRKKLMEISDSIRYHDRDLRTTDIEKYLAIQAQMDVDEKALLSYINNTDSLKNYKSIPQFIEQL